MKHVSGVTLDDAITARPDLAWSSKLAIAAGIARIVLAGHLATRTVMHRDLKPSNIMITNFEYQGVFLPDVVVLDFDMSWHKGSSEKDVVFESRDDFGYLAPEQTTSMRGVSAVSTRVDSYGLGMTLFFLFGGNHPRPNEGLSDGWLGLAERAAARGYDQKWRSAPKRLGRLIRDCTRIVQAERLDFAVAAKEIAALEQSMLSPQEIENPELFAEEFLAHLPIPANYEWFGGPAGGEVKLGRGLHISVRPDFRNAEINFELTYIDQGMQSYGDLSRRLDGALESGAKELERAGWRVIVKQRGNNQVALKCGCGIEKCQAGFDAIIRSGTQAYKAFEAVMPR